MYKKRNKERVAKSEPPKETPSLVVVDDLNRIGDMLSAKIDQQIDAIRKYASRKNVTYEFDVMRDSYGFIDKVVAKPKG